jgi:hypothetical protein
MIASESPFPDEGRSNTGRDRAGGPGLVGDPEVK